MPMTDLSKILMTAVILTLIFSCSRTGQEKRRLENEQKQKAVSTDRHEQTGETDETSNIIELKEKGGVYYIPVTINGVTLDFVFDTGASVISISETEAIFLAKQGLLHEEDFLGPTRFSDATGTVSEGTLINLREVKIGDKTLNNVTASIVHNLDAPLLLGQSALKQFGRVTIDYEEGVVVLE